MQSDKENILDSTEKEFIDTCNKMILSNDPVEAMYGRVARSVLLAWGNAFSDPRSVSAPDVISIALNAAAWCLASTVAPLARGDKTGTLRELILKEFTTKFNSRWDFIKETLRK